MRAVWRLWRARTEPTFFLGIAMAQSAGLIGVALSWVVEALWPYLVALVFTATGLIITAPTRGSLNRQQQRLTAQGFPLSLEEALRGTPPGDWRGR